MGYVSCYAGLVSFLAGTCDCLVNTKVVAMLTRDRGDIGMRSVGIKNQKERSQLHTGPRSKVRTPQAGRILLILSSASILRLSRAAATGRL
jgi:hypothetical protein